MKNPPNLMLLGEKSDDVRYDLLLCHTTSKEWSNAAAGSDDCPITTVADNTESKQLRARVKGRGDPRSSEPSIGLGGLESNECRLTKPV